MQTREQQKGRTVGSVLLPVLTVLLVGIIIGVSIFTTRALGETMESEGDGFRLTDKTFTAAEGFVYSADVKFTDGQAAGLVFGAAEGTHYWVFNIDRRDNRVKLMYFAPDEAGNMTAQVLREAPFIGTDTMTDADRALVSPKVATLDSVHLKAVITPDKSGAVYAEFYADGIRRFRTTYTDDDVIDLNTLAEGVTYEGGALGYNTYASRVAFEEVAIGKSDYTYYTELYRQQYHFSQYAHWNNDPNGLVYYDGYYHLYYQQHPYSNYWSDMYWGHARSRDLLHWELLPICLFPNEGTEGLGEGNGYAWSGSAMVYHRGTSAAVDAENWFPKGDGDGLMIFYTRDGARQDQVIATSDDGGFSWTRRVLIPQTTATSDIGITDGKTDCRDPKVFSLEKDAGGNTTRWGMVLTGQATNRIWFLKSTDLLHWEYAGGFTMSRPECPDIATLTLSGTSYEVMTFTARKYIVGHIRYNAENGQIELTAPDGTVITDGDAYAKTMDFGPDSYATQTYFIDDTSSAYFGKTVSLSWFSGVPGAAEAIESGALAAARGRWNGGGFTIPVIWGLKDENGSLLLTQTPITRESTDFEALRTELLREGNLTLQADSQNPLAGVTGRALEIALTLENPSGAPIAIRVNMNAKEYVEIGWTAETGYYVDRTHAGDAGLNLGNYAAKFTSGAVDSRRQSFYILVDQGGVEVFCEDFSRPFYLLTFSSPYATGASLSVGGEVTVEEMTVNRIASVWRDDSVTDETVLYVDRTDVKLDRTLTTSCDVLAYTASGADITWEIVSGDEYITLTETAEGATITSKAKGTAVVRATSGNASRDITVTVSDGSIETDLPIVPDGKYSGNWYFTEAGLVGEKTAGDGFLLLGASGSDFIYTASLDMGSGAAAALVFRARADMSDYLIANYDKNGNVVKLWSPRGEIARAEVSGVDVSSLVLKVRANGRNIRVYLNGNEVINTTIGEEEPTEGLFGLNVCATRAVFRSLTLFEEAMTWNGGALTVRGDVSQTVWRLTNRTLGNTALSPNFYTSDGRLLTVSPEYLARLPIGVYTFTAVGALSSYDFTVTVTEQQHTPLADSASAEAGTNLTVSLGGRIPTSVLLDGASLPADAYTIRGDLLTVSAAYLTTGEHTLTLDDESISVSIYPGATTTVGTKKNNSDSVADQGSAKVGLIVGLAVGGTVALTGAGVAVTLLLKKKKRTQSSASEPDEEPKK